MSAIITVENLSKRYHLGQIGATTLRDSAERLLHRLRGRNPAHHMGKVGYGKGSDEGRGKSDELRVTSDEKFETSDGKRVTSDEGSRADSSVTDHPSPLPSPVTDSDDLWALRDVSFEVQPGEVLGIIGRNGAGKSTLLKILSRITEPTSGRAIIRGRVASLLEVGTGFHPELTGRENIFLNGAILGMKKAEIARKFDEIVAFAEVDRFIDTPVKRYSSGMYVRLAFAVAAHLEPEILVVDEVLAVGDANFQKKCLGKMSEVSHAGRTVLFVSHNMVAMRSLCKHCLWLDAGVVNESGPSNGVVDHYLMRGVAARMDRKWADNPQTAPGNKDIRILSARVVKGADSREDILRVTTPLGLEFALMNNAQDIFMNFTAHIYTLSGTYAFAAGSGGRMFRKGMIYATMEIPANFLNDEVYTVSLQIVKDGCTTVHLEPDILSFEVHDVERQGAWQGKWPGVIRPGMEWNITTG